MDNTLYVSLSRQMTLRREMDIIANNIAHVDTTGFKVENLMVRTEPAAPASMKDGPNPVKFVLDDGVARDFTQGSFRTTGGALPSQPSVNVSSLLPACQMSIERKCDCVGFG